MCVAWCCDVVLEVSCVLFVHCSLFVDECC